jgi:hypothetical protein
VGLVVGRVVMVPTRQMGAVARVVVRVVLVDRVDALALTHTIHVAQLPHDLLKTDSQSDALGSLSVLNEEGNAAVDGREWSSPQTDRKIACTCPPADRLSTVRYL